MFMVTARHSQHIYSAIKIRKCRKGTSELENIVNNTKYGIHLATFPTSDTILRHLNTTYEYVNSGSSYF
jgi:hypothetical protein